MKKVVMAAGLLALAQWASAESGTYDGNWTVAWMSRGQNPTEVRGDLQLHGSQGTWRVRAVNPLHSRVDACVGRPYPVTVDHSDEVGLVLSVHASQVLQGCTDFHVTFMRAAGGRLEGHFNAGQQAVVATQN